MSSSASRFSRHVQATVWSKDHDSRFTMTMQSDLENELSDPHLVADDDLFAAHVDGYTHHGCARPGERRAGRL